MLFRSTRMREIRALFELAIEKVGDMYWCYDNYACFEAEFGDIALAKKYLTKAENSQNSRNADLYKVCANFALKREMKDYALEFFEKAIHFKVDNKTIESYNTLKQELEEAKKKQSKKRTLFKKETEENKEENKEKEKTEKEIISEKKEEPKKNTKKKSPSPMEAFLPDDVLEEMNAEEQQQESIPISEEPKEEESDFEKRRKAREEMRSRHRRRRTENTEE